MIVHDVPSSKLPFELLTIQGTLPPPSVHSGLSRRLAARDVPIEHLFARPPRAGKLKVLMIVNPTEDLAGAEQEAAAVQAILEQQQDRVESPRVLSGPRRRSRQCSRRCRSRHSALLRPRLFRRS